VVCHELQLIDRLTSSLKLIGANRNGGRILVKASTDWQISTGVQFSAGSGYTGFAHLRHYTARFCVWGDGPSLVLVPGLAGGFELLGPLARLLAKHFQVISYQLRGEDDCFALRQKFGLSDLVGDLRELLDFLGLESPPIFGVSFGGMLALELAAAHPHRLQSLIVQGTGARFEPGALQQVAGLVLSRYPLPVDNPFVNQFFNLFFGNRQKQGPLFQFVTKQCWQTDQSVMAHRFRMVETFDMQGRLGRIRVPALIMAGDRDLLVSAASLRTLAAGLRDPQLVQLRGCGHLAFVTQPERVAEEVRQFLEE
jgi:3-oxoadipate enol-lactonase